MIRLLLGICFSTKELDFYRKLGKWNPIQKLQFCSFIAEYDEITMSRAIRRVRLSVINNVDQVLLMSPIRQVLQTGRHRLCVFHFVKRVRIRS